MTRLYNRKQVFWSACLGMLLFGIGLLTLGSVLPDLMIKHSLDAVGAGTLFSIMSLGIIGGSLLFGPVCDRYGYKPLLVISSLLMFAGFEGLALTGTTGLLVISVLMIGLGGGAINGATNAVVADISTTGKGADLSLLGVFFGIGALGMPLLLSILEKSVDFEVIISATGFLALAASLIFFLVVFPPAKQSGGISMKMINGLSQGRRDIVCCILPLLPERIRRSHQQLDNNLSYRPALCITGQCPYSTLIICRRDDGHEIADRQRFPQGVREETAFLIIRDNICCPGPDKVQRFNSCVSGGVCASWCRTCSRLPDYARVSLETDTLTYQGQLSASLWPLLS